jgi:hypothetical protein
MQHSTFYALSEMLVTISRQKKDVLRHSERSNLRQLQRRHARVNVDSGPQHLEPSNRIAEGPKSHMSVST